MGKIKKNVEIYTIVSVKERKLLGGGGDDILHTVPHCGQSKICNIF
jgi:hypothetical protein